MLEDFFTMYGYDVLMASDPDTAFKRLKDSQAILDAMILDIALDDNRSGLEVLELMRLDDRFVDLTVVVLTGLPNLDDRDIDIITRNRAHLLYKQEGYERVFNKLDHIIKPLRKAAAPDVPSHEPQHWRASVVSCDSGAHVAPRAPRFVPPRTRHCHHGRHGRNGRRLQTSKHTRSRSDTLIPVAVESVQLGSIRAVVSATGQVTTLPGANLLLRATSGTHSEVTKAVGDVVKSGETLVRFEFPSLRAETAVTAALRAAELRVKNAKTSQGRIHGLIEHGAASRMEVEDADREVNDAEAELALVRATQSSTEAKGKNTSLTAPFNGIIAKRLHNPGDSVVGSVGIRFLRFSTRNKCR